MQRNAEVGLFTKPSMIEIAQFDEVTQIRISRVIDGVPIYRVSAYLVDGLLINTGCDYTAEEMVS